MGDVLATVLWACSALTIAGVAVGLAWVIDRGPDPRRHDPGLHAARRD